MFAHRIETTISQDGFLNLKSLPFSKGEHVEVIILRQSLKKSQTGKRTVGEYVGKIRMRDDFSTPLPDSFWLGADQ
jgi:hypothetical protein